MKKNAAKELPSLRDGKTSWTPVEIRGLRCRLGWSQAELARHLQTELFTVMNWETGRLVPLGDHLSRLARISQTAEVNADRMQRRPIAESLMREQGLSQIHDLDVLDQITDSAIRPKP